MVRSWRALTLAASLLLGGFGGACTDTPEPSSPTATPAQADRPIMQVSPERVEFGAVEVGESGEETLTVTNVGTAPLLNIQIELTQSVDVFSARVEGGVPDSLAPQASFSIALGATPIEAGEVGGKLILRSNDEQNSPLEVDLTVQGVRPGYTPTVTPAPQTDTPTVGTQTPGGGGTSSPTPGQVSPERTSTPGEVTPGGTGTLPEESPGLGTDTPGEGSPEPSATPGGGTPGASPTPDPSGTPGQTPTPEEPSPTQEPDLDEDGFSVGAGDCDDLDPDVYPGAEEVCDQKDNDCNGASDDNATDAVTYFADLDGDGYGDVVTSEIGCVAPPDFVEDSTDCDDDDPDVNPGAEERCNGFDDDCDGLADDDPVDEVLFYLDSDGDSFGVAGSTTSACRVPEGYAAVAGDCDDQDGLIYPGANEACDGKDNDCDQLVDEAGQSTWYYDGDSDGYGVTGTTQQSCGQPQGYVSVSGDCDDTDPAVSPGAQERCDGADQNCDGVADDGFDGDQDGFTSCGGDCNDADAGVNPAEAERCDSKDQDCDGVLDNGFDVDGDGYTVCGTDGDPRDCNDTSAAVYPGATEQCNGVDDDCDASVDEGVKTTFYRDADADGFGAASPTVQACSAPEGYSAQSGDCNDLNATVYPGALEYCDTLDNDCDGAVDEGVQTTYYLDADGDGYGNSASSALACRPPSSSYVTRGGDCNDFDSSSYPGATEICDGKDNDCDSSSDEGFDADKDGKTTCGGDCNDSDASVYTGATEVCDARDNNCNSVVDEGFDQDSDGATSCGSSTTPPDCNDNDALVRPGIPESCDGKDNNCNGQVDEGFDKDSDGFTTCEGDCNDNNAAINPDADDTPFDTVDSNCDGSDGDESGAVFVSASAASDGDGTRANPYRSLLTGVSAAASGGKQWVLVTAGSYPGSLALAEGVAVLGGYSSNFSQRDPDRYLSEIKGDAPTQSLPGAVVATSIKNKVTVLDGFTVTASAGSSAGASAVGLFAIDSNAALQVTRVDFVVAAGRAGSAGGNGVQGSNGRTGNGGLDANIIALACGTLPAASAGGQLTCSGVSTNGGNGGGMTCPTFNVFQPTGAAGANNLTGYGVGGGGRSDGFRSSAAVQGCNVCTLSTDWGSAAAGTAGSNGNDGSSGTGADADLFSLDGNLFVMPSGTSGNRGQAGGGGGGGGTGSGSQSINCGDHHGGATGGGGGSGACGGEFGVGGRSGGGSFGVVLRYTAAPASWPVLSDNVVTTADGGAGGIGGDGALGGIGGAGGNGGLDRTNGAWCTGRGGNGGKGGDGGTGGGGGGGAGGPSVGVYVVGAAPTVDYSADNLITIGRGGRGGRGGFGGRGSYGTDGEDGPAIDILVK